LNKEANMAAINAFREQLASNPVLQTQVRQTLEAGGGLDQLLNLARAHGCAFTVDETVSSFTESELSDFELEMVAGGKMGGGGLGGFGNSVFLFGLGGIGGW